MMTSSSFTKVASGTKMVESHSTSASSNQFNAETLPLSPTTGHASSTTGCVLNSRAVSSFLPSLLERDEGTRFDGRTVRI